MGVIVLKIDIHGGQHKYFQSSRAEWKPPTKQTSKRGFMVLKEGTLAALKVTASLAFAEANKEALQVTVSETLRGID